MYITRKELLEMKINNQNKKMYMLLIFAMIVMLFVFKIIYIRREYIYMTVWCKRDVYRNEK